MADTETPTREVPNLQPTGRCRHPFLQRDGWGDEEEGVDVPVPVCFVPDSNCLVLTHS